MIKSVLGRRYCTIWTRSSSLQVMKDFAHMYDDAYVMQSFIEDSEFLNAVFML